MGTTTKQKATLRAREARGNSRNGMLKVAHTWKTSPLRRLVPRRTERRRSPPDQSLSLGRPRLSRLNQRQRLTLPSMSPRRRHKKKSKSSRSKDKKKSKSSSKSKPDNEVSIEMEDLSKNRARGKKSRM